MGSPRLARGPRPSEKKWCHPGAAGSRHPGIESRDGVVATKILADNRDQPGAGPQGLECASSVIGASAGLHPSIKPIVRDVPGGQGRDA